MCKVLLLSRFLCGVNKQGSANNLHDMCAQIARHVQVAVMLAASSLNPPC